MRDAAARTARCELGACGVASCGAARATAGLRRAGAISTLASSTRRRCAAATAGGDTSAAPSCIGPPAGPGARQNNSTGAARQNNSSTGGRQNNSTRRGRAERFGRRRVSGGAGRAGYRAAHDLGLLGDPAARRSRRGLPGCSRSRRQRHSARPCEPRLAPRAAQRGRQQRQGRSGGLRPAAGRGSERPTLAGADAARPRGRCPAAARALRPMPLVECRERALGIECRRGRLQPPAHTARRPAAGAEDRARTAERSTAAAGGGAAAERRWQPCQLCALARVERRRA